MTTKTILTPSLFQFAYEIQEGVLEGYIIDEESPPNTFGVFYEALMVKPHEVAQDAVLTFENIPAKRGPKPKVA